MLRHNNKNTSGNGKNGPMKNTDGASNSERSPERTPRNNRLEDRERIRYNERNIFRLNDLYERGSI